MLVQMLVRRELGRRRCRGFKRAKGGGVNLRPLDCGKDENTDIVAVVPALLAASTNCTNEVYLVLNTKFAYFPTLIDNLLLSACSLVGLALQVTFTNCACIYGVISGTLGGAAVAGLAFCAVVVAEAD